MYYHTSPLCQPCKVIKPIAKRIAAQYGVEFKEMDVSKGEAVVADILSVPTVILVKNAELVGRLDANYINALSMRKMIENAEGL